MKTCSKCKAEKPRNKFSLDKRSSDGRRSQCKACDSEYQQSPAGKAAIRKYSKSPGGKVARTAVDRRFYLKNTEARKAASGEYRKTEAGKAISLRSVTKWQKKNPNKRSAHLVLNRAVRDGLVIKPVTCSECNEPIEPNILHGHHEDYSKPLEVDWLCAQCHKDLHKSLLETV